MLTSDLHHAVFGLHHQLLGREVVDIQRHLPVVLGLLDLRHATAHLAGQGASLLGGHGPWIHHGGVGHHEAHVRGQDGRPQVPRPVGAGERGEILVQGRHAERLVEDPAVLVPVAEWVPTGGAEQGERNPSLGHGGCVRGGEEERVWLQMKSPLAWLKMFSQRAECLSAECLYTH